MAPTQRGTGGHTCPHASFEDHCTSFSQTPMPAGVIFSSSKTEPAPLAWLPIAHRIKLEPWSWTSKALTHTHHHPAPRKTSFPATLKLCLQPYIPATSPPASTSHYSSIFLPGAQPPHCAVCSRGQYSLFCSFLWPQHLEQSSTQRS